MRSDSTAVGFPVCVSDSRNSSMCWLLSITATYSSSPSQATPLKPVISTEFPSASLAWFGREIIP